MRVFLILSRTCPLILGVALSFACGSDRPSGGGGGSTSDAGSASDAGSTSDAGSASDGGQSSGCDGGSCEGVDAGPGCDLSTSTTGATFEPKECSFQIISGGVPCEPSPCQPGYALSLRDGAPSHLQEVVFSGFSGDEGRFRVDPMQSLNEFSGYALDEASAVRNLLSGEVTLTPASDGNTTTVAFNGDFANNIHVEGSGTVPVMQLAAP